MMILNSLTEETLLLPLLQKLYSLLREQLLIAKFRTPGTWELLKQHIAHMLLKNVF